MSEIAVGTSDEGTTYRVVLERDTDAPFPDWDGLGTVLEVDYERPARVIHSDYGRKEASEALANVWNGLGIKSAWPSSADITELVSAGVVSIGRVSVDRSTMWVVLVTGADLEAWGCSPELEGTAAGGVADTLRQFVEGDVWGYSVEEKVIWTSRTGETRETWENTGESLWDMYGEDYARNEAFNALAGVLGGHDKYTECAS